MPLSSSAEALLPCTETDEVVDIMIETFVRKLNSRIRSDVDNMNGRSFLPAKGNGGSGAGLGSGQEIQK
jgi:hypothetical protein